MLQLSVFRALSFALPGLLALPSAVLGQATAPAEAPEPRPAATLDVDRLIAATGLTTASVDGPVWQIAAREGFQLLTIPVELHPPAKETRLDRSPVEVRGARFVCWRLEPNDPDRARREEADIRADDTTLPEGAPLITRSLTLTPNGRATWQVDRVIAGGTLKTGDEPFLLKIRPDRLRELRPPRPERVTQQPNETRAAFALRRRETDAAYREAIDAYRDLTRLVTDLPDEMTAPVDWPRVWAVYEVRGEQTELSFAGAPPLPWTVTVDQLAAARSLMARGGGAPSPEQYQQLAVVLPLLAGGHPISHDLLGRVLVEGSLVAHAQPRGPITRAVTAVLDGPAEQWRPQIVRDLVTAPPTTGTTQLLRAAAKHLDDEAKRIAYRSRFEAIARSAEGFDEVLTEANRGLREQTAVDPGELFERLLARAGSTPESIEAVVKGIELESLEQTRRDAMIEAVVESAAEHPAAARLLDERLLTSGDTEVVKAALAALTPDPPQTQPAAATKGAGEGGDAAPVQPGVEEAPRRIPLTPGHRLLPLLASSDDEVRDAAWAALTRFTVQDGGRGAASSGVFDRLLAAGVERDTVPPELLAFLRRELTAGGDVAVEVLAQLAVGPDIEAGTAAAGRLIGSRGPLAARLAEMTRDQRHRFAARVYRARGVDPPAVVALIRAQAANAAAPVVTWFAGQVAASDGGLPTEEDWLAQYQDERDLLALVTQDDRFLTFAVSAALSRRLAGDTELAGEITKAFARLRDRSIQNVRDTWDDLKTDRRNKALTAATGSWNLVLTVPPGEDGGEATTIPLGRIELKVTPAEATVTGGLLRLTPVVDQVAIELVDPTELKRFSAEGVEGMPLSRRRPMVLRPDAEGGTWSGQTVLEDGQAVRLTLEPVGKSPGGGTAGRR